MAFNSALTGAPSGSRGPDDCRRSLHNSQLGTIVDMTASAARPPSSGRSGTHQVVLPYFGVFGRTIGRRTALLDANRTLFVTAGEDYVDTHPVPGLGHARLVIEPSITTLEELCGRADAGSHPVFRDVSRPATPELRIMTLHLRGLAFHGGDPLRIDELAISTLRHALGPNDCQLRPTSLHVVNRAKQFLHAYGSESLTLDMISREVGVSPTYLTQAFTRSEGLPLYRYQMRLRLSRALLELPLRESITELALDLGFSSHSHFSASFKAAYGVTPSEFRVCARPYVVIAGLCDSRKNLG